MNLKRQQIAEAWDGIPKTYWPEPDKPWRVSWGFGAHTDFATKEAADEEVTPLRANLFADWDSTVADPFNVHDRTREMMKS